MKLSTLLIPAGSAFSAASPAPELDSCGPEGLSPRPTPVPHPYNPRLPIPNPPERDRVCYVKSHNDGVSDDSCLVLSALRQCNNGGRAVFQAEYNIYNRQSFRFDFP